MARIKKTGRRFGRGADTALADSSTHLIKIGWDIRKDGDPYPKPQRLPGFLLCRNTTGPDGRPVIDFQTMAKLGITKDNIDAAIRQGIKAPAGTLPDQLEFVIVGNSHDIDGVWQHPIFSEQYVCYKKTGLFCSGDGINAKRKQNDGTQKPLTCNPVGKDGVTAQSFCPESVNKECKSFIRLSFLLVQRTETGFKALSDLPNARFRFDSSSEYSAIGVGDALDEAADRLGGYLDGISGTITFSIKRRRNQQGQSIAPAFSIVLNEGEIRERERMMQGGDQVLIESPERNLISAPVEPDPVDFESAHDEPAWAASEDIEQEPDLGHYEPTDEDLRAALHSYIVDVSNEEGCSFEEVFRRVCPDKTPGGTEIPYNPVDTQWFFQGSNDQKDKFRRQILRDVCAKLEGDDRFEVGRVEV